MSQTTRRQLDDKGRCYGRKPIYYKGGSWNSSLNSPKFLCDRYGCEYDPDGQ